MQVEKQARIDGVGDIMEEVASEHVDPDAIEEEEDSDGQSRAHSKAQESLERDAAEAALLAKRRLRKLKPSGIVNSLFIDPDVSEDDENNVVKRMRAEEARRKGE